MVSIAVYHDCGRTYQVRVIDLFREWDEDGDGTISKKEFRKAMPLLGFDAPRATVDQVFDSFDPDGGGAISIDELNKALRRGGEVKLSADLQAGSKGKIGTVSTTKIAVRLLPTTAHSSPQQT